MKPIFAVAIALSLLACGASASQETRPLLKKSRQVTLTLPLSAFDYAGLSVWSGLTSYSLEGTLTTSGVDWNTHTDISGAFPAMIGCVVRSTELKAARAHIEIGCSSAGLRAIVLKIDISGVTTPAESERAASAFLLAGAPVSEEARAFLDGAYRRMATKWFVGDLSVVSPPSQLALIRFAHESAKGVDFKMATYKDQRYFDVDLGDPEPVFNDLRMNQSARVAKILNDDLLSVMKAFGQAVAGDIQNLYGLKLERRIMHKDFIQERNTGPDSDALVIYAPIELIKKFAAADITSQQFIDGCVVIVNDNRIQVPLSSS